MSNKTITHEGVEYIAKDHVDEIVRQRISKYTEKLTEAETKLQQYQTQIDDAQSRLGLVDQLSKQVETLQGDLVKSQSLYERHSTISRYGISDTDSRDAVEWAYERATSTMQKDKPSLSQWLDGIQQNPDSAPSIIKNLFVKSETASPQVPSPQVQNPSPQIQTPQVQTPSPKTNAGVQQVQSTPSDLLSRAGDPEFYSKNREAIKEAFYRQSGKASSPFKF